MISLGRRGTVLLASIATAGMLIGSVAVAAPATVNPSGLQPLFGGEETEAEPVLAARTSTSWRIEAPVPVELPPIPPPPDPAVELLNPPLGVALPPPPAPLPPPPPPVAVHVAGSEDPDEDEEEPEEAEDEDEEPAPPPVEAVSVSGALSRVIELTNNERRKAGCGSLRPDGRLTRAAQGHAADMAENDYFSHYSQDGTYFETRVRRHGYPRPGAENIANGQSSPEQVVRDWMRSPSHRAAILTCEFVTIGVGRDDNYWVQEFGE